MKKSLKTNDVVSAYKVLESAKYQKLEDEDKIKVWKISRTLKPISAQFNEAKEDATRAFLTEEVMQNYQKAQAYEKGRKEGDENLPMTDEEYKAFVIEFLKSKTVTEKALGELLEKEVELDIDTLSEEAFGKLMASNDWDMSQVDALEFMVG